MTFEESLDLMSSGSFTIQGGKSLSDQFLVARICKGRGLSVAINKTNSGDRSIIVWKKESIN